MCSAQLSILCPCSMNLTWRDMQHLVVRTSQPGHLSAIDWKTNGVGRRGRGWFFQIKSRWYYVVLYLYTVGHPQQRNNFCKRKNNFCYSKSLFSVNITMCRMSYLCRYTRLTLPALCTFKSVENCTLSNTARSNTALTKHYSL